MVVGVARVEVHLPRAQSLKDKRSVLKSVRDQLRGRFNVAVAEVEPNERWQRAVLGLAAVGEDRPYVEGLMREVLAWMRNSHLFAIVRIEEEYG